MHFSRLVLPTVLGAGFLTAFAAPGMAVTILVDLNTNAGAGGPGGTWNSYAVPTDINGGTLVDSGNLPTGVTFSVAGTITDNTANGGLVVFNPAQPGFEGLPSWAATSTDDDAAGDNFFTSNTGAVIHSFTLTFGGITPGTVLSLDLLASRDSTAALGFYEYSLDGGSSWFGFTVFNADGTLATTGGWDTNTTQSQVFGLQTQGYQLHRYMNASNLTATGTTLDVRVTDANATASTFAAVNAMRLEIVPEPTSAVLLLAGALALGGAARRRRPSA